VSFVYIMNCQGRPLMPCSPRKARVLLKAGKAKVVKAVPFTLQLLYGSSGYTQEITLTFSHNFGCELVIESIKEESRQEKGCA